MVAQLQQPNAVARPPKKPPAETKPAKPPTRADESREAIENRLLEVTPIEVEKATLKTLAVQLRAATKLPIVLDPRGIELAGAFQNGETISFESEHLPVQVALREMLREHGLRAQLRDDSVVITADTAELARRGKIETSSWVNVDKPAAAAIAKALDTKISKSFVDMPLSDALKAISEEIEIPILLDVRSLESIGLNSKEPVTSEMKGVTARSFLMSFLNPYELAIQIDREHLRVTTIEASESKLMLRIYWLDGLGVYEQNNDLLVELIQTSIQPDSWDLLGGPAILMAMPGTGHQRAGLSVDATMMVHEQIEALINTLRENYLGPDYVDADITSPRMMMNGGGMGGGGGMF